VILPIALVAALVLALPAGLAPDVAAARQPGGARDCASGVAFLGFSDALDKGSLAGTNVGGLSGLVYDRGRDVYYGLVDNERETPARFYTIEAPLGGDGLGAPRASAVTTLRDGVGQPLTGANFDGEGIALTGRGDLLIASETEPAIRRFALDGRLLEELPVPARFLVVPRGEARANLTFESLTLSPDGGGLFTAVEEPLPSDGQTTDRRNRIRVLRYAERGGSFAPAEQYFYLTEPAQATVELVALSERALLVLERGFVSGAGNTVRVFIASLDGAADVSGAATLDAPGPAPLAKELLFDLADCPASGATNRGPQANPLLDNFESLALGPRLADGRQTLLLVSDDNFGQNQVTRFVAVATTRTAPTPGMPNTGAGGGASDGQWEGAVMALRGAGTLLAILAAAGAARLAAGRRGSPAAAR
jgi:hypothetical protein